jgi:hypothetical protein
VVSISSLTAVRVQNANMSAPQFSAATCVARLLWEPQPGDTGTWQGQSVPAASWNTLSNGSDSWSSQGNGSTTWTPLDNGTATWQKAA